MLFALVLLAASAQAPVDPGLEFEEIIGGLTKPTTMAFIGPDDILVLIKDTGEVLRVTEGALVGPVLDVHVDTRGSRGMLGIATDPDFQNNGRVYMYYTESAAC